jgi:hypothetical protein
MHTLQDLQRWYHSPCDGDCEHGYRVEIGTLDNPEWRVLFESTAVLGYALGVGLCCHLFVVLYEEPHLRRVFGAEYEDYCLRVGRWLPKWW